MPSLGLELSRFCVCERPRPQLIVSFCSCHIYFFVQSIVDQITLKIMRTLGDGFEFQIRVTNLKCVVAENKIPVRLSFENDVLMLEFRRHLY